MRAKKRRQEMAEDTLAAEAANQTGTADLCEPEDVEDDSFEAERDGRVAERQSKIAKAKVDAARAREKRRTQQRDLDVKLGKEIEDACTGYRKEYGCLIERYRSAWENLTKWVKAAEKKVAKPH